MATVEENFQRMQQHLQSLGAPKPMSWTEFLRDQEVQSAERFGLVRPVHRTSVDLRFHGQAVQAHNLYAKICTSMVEKLVDLVEEAGHELATIRGSFGLFFSPLVHQGSTVVTLFGEPRLEEPDQELLATGIADSPLDAALDKVFSAINLVSSANQETRPSLLEVSGPLGKRLFRFTETLLTNNIDLDLTWTRPSGYALTESISQDRASHIKTVLDFPITAINPRNKTGTLEQIAIDGSFKVQLDEDRRRIVTLTAPENRREELRLLWGRTVRIEYIETLTSFPQREFDSPPEYEFINITEAPFYPSTTLE